MKILISRAGPIILFGLAIYALNLFSCCAGQPHAIKACEKAITFYQLGKRSAEIEKIYGTPDKRLDLLQRRSSLGEGERSERESWEYSSCGFTFEFRNDKLARINALGSFEGEIDGIRIGDTEKAIISKKGMPDGQPTSSRWTYKKGHAPKGWTNYIDFDDSGKVKRICILANPHKHHNVKK